MKRFLTTSKYRTQWKWCQKTNKHKTDNPFVTHFCPCVSSIVWNNDNKKKINKKFSPQARKYLQSPRRWQRVCHCGTTRKLGLLSKRLVRQPTPCLKKKIIIIIIKEKNCRLLYHRCDPTSNFEIPTPTCASKCAKPRALVLPLWSHGGTGRTLSPCVFLIG